MCNLGSQIYLLDLAKNVFARVKRASLFTLNYKLWSEKVL